MSGVITDLARGVPQACARCGSAILAAAILCLSAVQLAGPAEAGGKAVILAINDVYRLKGVNGGADGGMARVRALRAELEKAAPDLLFLHAGDFLSPSFLGRTYKGAQMIDLMNVMDGDPAAGSHDPRMFVAFGNHEFDDTHCSKEGPLGLRVAESEFTWLASNLDFTRCDPLKGLAGSDRIARSRIVESGGLSIGLYGITLSRSSYGAIVADPVQASCDQVRALRSAGADVIVALTHLPWDTDLTLLGLTSSGAALPGAGRRCTDTPDLVIGGHDHRAMALPVDKPKLFKADADAISAWVVEVSKDGEGHVRIDARLVPLDKSRRPDPLAERLADLWLSRHDERFCTRDCLFKGGDERKLCLAKVDDGACLKEEIARANGLVETEEVVNRSEETGFGDWIADRVRAAGAADVAFLNAGGIRLNYNLTEGTMITRRHLEEMFPFKNKLVVRDVPGKALWHAVKRAVRKRGEGGWAHFAGMAVRLESGGGRQVLSQILVRRNDGKIVEIGPDTAETVRVASVSFVLADGDRHGFKLCPNVTDMWACKDKLEESPNWPLTGDASDLAGFVRQELLEASKTSSLAFAKDGRLCDPGQSDCLIDRWKRGE